MAQVPGQRLAQLQTIDLALAKYRTRLREIDTALGADTRIRAAQEAQQTTDVHRREQQATVQRLSSEHESLVAKRTAADEQLYSGRINNPKELTELQQEVEALDRQLAKLAESLTEARLAEEQAVQAHEEARQALTQAEETFAHAQSDLVNEKKRLSGDFRSQAQLRKDTVAEIPPEIMARYEDLRVKKKGIAVARVRDSACQVCGVEITTRIAMQVRAGEMVLCESCGRLLVTQ
jgi:uncharacterized protein